MRKGYVRRALIGGLVLMMLLSGIAWAAAEILGGAITLMRTPQGGDEMILLQMDAEETEKMQSAVMSGKEDVLSSAVLDEDLLILRLSRPLKSGEDIHVTVSVNERFQKTLELTVKSALNPKNRFSLSYRMTLYICQRHGRRFRLLYIRMKRRKSVSMKAMRILKSPCLAGCLKAGRCGLQKACRLN